MVSLDFELFWGVRDKKTLDQYRENLLAVRAVVPSLLELFRKHEIHATWATVGFLFLKTRNELMESLPAKRPTYEDQNLSPYADLHRIGVNESEDPFHYAPSLIEMIAACPYQEIGSHTFSHYYCLESGQDATSFREDLKAAIEAAKRYDLNIESLVFPRNQCNREYLAVCKEMGIKAYRGTESSWLYQARNEGEDSLFKKGLRLIDAYVNISGYHCYSQDKIACEFPFNIPSSRYLRPYLSRLRVLEPLRLRRVSSNLSYAARKGLIYHLWWHPHHFGGHIKESLSLLRKILDHYLKLRKMYGMESLNMGELTRRLIQQGAYDG